MDIKGNAKRVGNMAKDEAKGMVVDTVSSVIQGLIIKLIIVILIIVGGYYFITDYVFTAISETKQEVVSSVKEVAVTTKDSVITLKDVVGEKIEKIDLNPLVGSVKELTASAKVIINNEVNVSLIEAEDTNKTSILDKVKVIALEKYSMWNRPE